MTSKACLIMVVSLFVVAACSKPGQVSLNQAPSPNQPAKKVYYFVRKVNGKLSPLHPELGEQKDAQRVEGQITGPIVQKTEGPREKTKDGKYIYTLMVTDGKDIEMIDGNGIYQAVGTNITVFAANLDKGDLDDLDFLKTGMASKATSAPDLRLPSGDKMGRFVFKTNKQAAGTLKLAGEFRTENNGQVTPALQVNTDNGVVVIPVEQLIPFKKKPAPSPSAK